MMSMSRWIADTTTDVGLKFWLVQIALRTSFFRKELELTGRCLFRVGLTLTSALPGEANRGRLTGPISTRFDDPALVADLDQRARLPVRAEPFGRVGKEEPSGARL